MLALTISVISFPSNVHAQAKLTEGKPAPTDGVFYTVKEHAKLVSKIDKQKKRCQLEKEFVKDKVKLQYNLKLDKLKIDVNTLEYRLSIQKSLYKDNKNLLLKELEKAKTTPWYRHPQFVFWSGFVVSTVAYGLLTWGYTELRDKIQ